MPPFSPHADIFRLPAAAAADAAPLPPPLFYFGFAAAIDAATPDVDAMPMPLAAIFRHFAKHLPRLFFIT
jgi:hypothetical protein